MGDGFVFTAGGWGGKETIKAFALTGTGDLGETQLKWELRKGMPKVPSMIYQKPYLYAMIDQGVASCIEAATGKVVWQERVGGNFSASPVAAAGRLYFLGDSGETVVLAMGPKFEVWPRIRSVSESKPRQPFPKGDSSSRRISTCGASNRPVAEFTMPMRLRCKSDSIVLHQVCTICHLFPFAIHFD